MRKYLLPFAFIIFFIENISAQEPVLNYKNFVGPMFSSFDLTSSKVVLKDTFQLFEGGTNLIWDFSQFGGITDTTLPKYTYSFLPKEESWLLDSATNKWFWTNPEISFVFREDKNRMIQSTEGKTVPNIFDWYFYETDTLIEFSGQGSSINNRIASTPAIIDFFRIGFVRGSYINSLPFSLNQIFTDSVSIDTLGSNPTFWTIRKDKSLKSFDATGKVIFPFGEVQNSLRFFELGIRETEKVNKLTGVSQTDSVIGFNAFWYAPDLQYCVPIAKLDFHAEKLYGGKWQVDLLDAYITDQRSLAIMGNWQTPVENWFYPNPAKDEVILIEIENATNFKIFGLNGQLIKQNVLNSNRISVEGLPPNLYILEVENQTEKFRSKLIIH